MLLCIYIIIYIYTSSTYGLYISPSTIFHSSHDDDDDEDPILYTRPLPCRLPTDTYIYIYVCAYLRPAYPSSPPPHNIHTIYPAKDVGVTHYWRVAWWIRRANARRSLRGAERRSSSAIKALNRDGFPVYSRKR